MARRSLIAATLALGLLAGCSGYSTSRLTDFPQARTIALRPFENLGFRRDLELRLTQAVASEVRARTSLGIADPATADLVMTGRMEANEGPVALDETGAVIQKRLEGWLEIEVVERATGRVVRRGRVDTVSEWRDGADGESLAGSATEEWIRRLGEQVAQVLERGF